jgi:hypothetical protein
VKKFIDQKDRDITHRYQFYKLNAYLVRESNWTVEAWADLLDDFVEVVRWKFQGTIFVIIRCFMFSRNVSMASRAPLLVQDFRMKSGRARSAASSSKPGWPSCAMSCRSRTTNP